MVRRPHLRVAVEGARSGHQVRHLRAVAALCQARGHAQQALHAFLLTGVKRSHGTRAALQQAAWRGGSLRGANKAALVRRVGGDPARCTHACVAHVHTCPRTRTPARTLRAMEPHLECLLRVGTCLAQNGYGAQVGLLAATARAFRADAQLWAAQARYKGPAGRTALMHAAGTGDLARTTFLLQHGADAGAQERKAGESPLHLACLNGCFATARALVERGGASVHAAQSSNGFTALMGAAQEGHLDIVRWLLDQGAEANYATPATGQTALISACHQGHLEVARCLVESGGARVNAADPASGNTALAAASRSGHLGAVTYLLGRGANGATAALCGACYEGHLEVLRALLERGGAEADGGAEPDSLSALFWAARAGKLELVRFLVERWGANVNAANGDLGLTALMGASVTGALGCVRYLLQHGADRHARCHGAHTALEYARDHPLVQAELRLETG